MDLQGTGTYNRVTKLGQASYRVSKLGDRYNMTELSH